MKKILILANSSSGLYDFRNELVEDLLKKYEVTVSLPDDVKTDKLADEGCKVVHTPINRRGVNPFEDIKLVMSYLKLLKCTKPDLVLTYTIKPNIYGGLCCRIKNIPYIETITGLGSTFQRNGIFLKLIVHLYRIGLKKASCIFFQNKENMEVFERHHIKGKASRLVSGSGVNLEYHAAKPYPEGGRTVFLYIGRIMREKGIEELLEAARALHDENTEFQLLGYCDEDYREKLDECEKNGWITQLGFDTDVRSHLCRASAVVLPTYHEGMSNVLMEASATARPVIATSISGCREIFDEGITGFGCKPKSSDDLMKAIKKFLKLSVEERAMMGKKAREKMEREFDRRRVVNAYMEEINSIL